jgi:hypothetical protein
MLNTESGNTSTAQDSNSKNYSPKDWREARCEWRRERREARQRSPYRGLIPGLILIMIGTLTLATQQEWISAGTLWEYLVIGIGFILIISGLINFRNPYYPYGMLWRIIPGSALIVTGVLSIFGFSQLWPLILIVAGIVILGFVFLRQQNKQH